MTLDPHDFRKPAPLASSLRSSLADWLPQVCGQTIRLWGSRVSFPVEMESRGLGVLPAWSALESLPDNALRFRSNRTGSSDSSFFFIPRPLLLALLGDLLGEAYDPATPDRDLTVVEENIVDFVVEQFFLDPLVQTWPLPIKLKLDPPRSESRAGAPPFLPGALLLVAHFLVRGPFGEVEWWWTLPRSGWLEAIAQGSEDTGIPLSRKEREGLVRELPLRLTVHLGSVALSLFHLASLRVGDVLVLDQPIDQPLPASLGGRAKFTVRPGARGTRQAVSIQTLIES